MVNTFALESTFPPSLQDNPLLAMFTVMAFWWIVLTCLQWIYEIVAANREEPKPSKGTYIAVARRVRFWLVMSGLVCALPRLVQLMAWQVLSPWWRELIASLAWLVVIPAAAMVMFSWWQNKRLVQTEEDFVNINGFIPASAIPRSEKGMSAVVVLVIFVIAVATTFVRPSADARSTSTVVERRAG